MIDSGAIYHIASDVDLLEETEKAIGELPVIIPNGDRVSVEGIEKGHLPNGMKIDHVLNIPDFKSNLISISRLTEHFNCALIFITSFSMI